MEQSAETDPPKVPPLGPTLRLRRHAAGLTLKALSARSGISVSMLSQIERGQTNPTFATVWRLTSALGMSLGSLVEPVSPGSGGGQPGEIVRLRSCMTPEMRSEDGGCVVRALNPLRLQVPVEWYEMHFQPQSLLQSEPHPAGTVEHLTVLDGSVVVQSGGASATAGPGDTLRYPADRPHSIANPNGSAAAVLVVVVYDAGSGEV